MLFLLPLSPRGFLLFMMDRPYKYNRKQPKVRTFHATKNWAEVQCGQRKLFSVREAICSDFSLTVLVSEKQDATQATLFPRGVPTAILHGSIYCCGVVSRDMIESVLVVWLVSRSRIDLRVNVSAL